MEKSVYFLLFTGLILSSCTIKKDFYADKMAARISAAIGPQIGTKNIGAIVAIYHKGSVQFLSFGETAKGNKTPPDPDTLFEIGSITKTFTGLMLARSIDLKRVSAKSTLDQFNKEWKNQKTGSIYLSELITHRSGLPRMPCNFHWTDIKRPYAEYDENDLIAGLKDSSFNSDCVLKNHPTKEIHYSNWGVGVLGYILASKEKMSYERLLHQLVLDPLKLHDTVVTLNANQQKRMAMGYDANLNNTPFWEMKILQGQGAIKSSARDLIKYAQIYLHPELTPFENAIRLVMTPQHEAPKNQSMGLAWFIEKNGSIWHDGQTGGFASFIKIDPSRDLIVLYLTNTSHEINCVIDTVEEVPCDQLAK